MSVKKNSNFCYSSYKSQALYAYKLQNKNKRNPHHTYSGVQLNRLYLHVNPIVNFFKRTTSNRFLPLFGRRYFGQILTKPEQLLYKTHFNCPFKGKSRIGYVRHDQTTIRLNCSLLFKPDSKNSA